MWIPKYLILRNFISHSDTRFDFIQGQTCMIVGDNLDDDSQESNGSGKSGIIEGVGFALTGDSVRKVRSDELITNDRDEMSVEMSLVSSIDQRKLLIKRKVFRSKYKTSKLKVYLNDKELPYITSVNEGNAEILRLLDISKEDLLNYYIVSKNNHINFFDMSDSNKKQAIARFSNAALIDGVNGLIDSDLEIIEDDLRSIEQKKAHTSGQLSVYKRQLSSIKSEDTQQQVEEIKQAVEFLKKQNVEIEGQIKSLELEKKNIESQKDSMSLSVFSEELESVSSRLSQVQEGIDMITQKSRKIDQKIAELRVLLSGQVSCPKCNHSFNPTSPHKGMSKAARDVQLLENKLQSLKSKKQKGYTILEAVKKDKQRILQKQLEQSQAAALINRQIERILKQIEQKYKEIRQTKSEIDGLNSQINSISEVEIKSKIKALQTNIRLLNSKYKALDDQEQEMLAKSIQVGQWKDRFKQFQTHLANKSITSIEGYTNLYLKKIKSNITVQLSGYTLNKTGGIREKISVKICKDGNLVGNYGKLSGGEKVRVNISNILCQQRLINMSSKNGGLDLLLLDEVIESIDSSGVFEVMNALNCIDQTIAVITHSTTKNVFPNTIVVTKKAGLSTINHG